jgi:hypothetical protein
MEQNELKWCVDCGEVTSEGLFWSDSVGNQDVCRNCLDRRNGRVVYNKSEEVKVEKQQLLGQIILNDFSNAYVEAIMFTEFNCDNPELQDKGLWDFSIESLKKIIEDCASFENAYLCAIEVHNGQTDPDMEEVEVYRTQAGHDFWLNRNFHGTGFWDRKEYYGQLKDNLSDMAHSYGEVYVGLDDKGEVCLD